jgi:hypothetical protein
MGAFLLFPIVSRPCAAQQYPACLPPDALTERARYLRLVKQADVCAAAMGLHQSNGWKLAE